MKRSSHRSSYPAVLGLQPFKGFECDRISEHARNLGIIVSFGALWFAIGFLCALVIGPVMGVGG